jgi:PmbA protein
VDAEALLAIADEVVARAGDDEQVEAYVAHGVDTEVRAYEGDVESLSSAESQGVAVRVVSGGRMGFAWAGTLAPEVVSETLAEARDNARFATVDEHQGLAEPDGVDAAELDLFRSELAAVPTADKVAMAIELERAVRAADRRVVGIESAEYVDSLEVAALASTTGIRSSSSETACYLAAYALAADGDETQTGFGFSVGRGPTDLDVGAAAVDAAGRATRLLGAQRPTTDRVTVVLDPWVTAQLLGILGHTLTGEAVQKGRTPFADRLAELVASPQVTLVDDPTDERSFTATAVDGEGLATRRNELISGGVLGGFVHDALTARRAGSASTGCAVRGGLARTPSVGCRSLALVPGSMSQVELVAAVGEGVLVQDVAGLHSGVNPVSGDFSTGAEGLRITGGALAEPLREFTIASTLQRMLTDVSHVGSDLTWLPMSAAGVSLVIGDVTVSGA